MMERAHEADRAILTLAQACAHLQVSDKTLRAIIATGRLAASKVGATWRIRADDIDTYLEASRFIPASRADPSPSPLSGRETSWDRVLREGRARKRGR